VSGSYIGGGALATPDEVDDLDRIAGFEPDGVVLCAWYNGLIDFDRHPAAAHFEPFEQRWQAGVTLYRILFTVEPNCEARWDLGHRKSRFPDFEQAA
jgi:hypothetical protein